MQQRREAASSTHTAAGLPPVRKTQVVVYDRPAFCSHYIARIVILRGPNGYHSMFPFVEVHVLPFELEKFSTAHPRIDCQSDVLLPTYKPSVGPSHEGRVVERNKTPIKLDTIF